MSDWFKEINQKYSDGVAHAFIVHGNISDYVVAPSRLGAYLSKAHEKSVFIEYSIAGGLQFRTAAERKRVMDLIESSGKTSDEDAMMASIQATLGMSVPVESKRDDGESAIQMAPGQAIDVIYQIATASENGAPLSPVILIHAGDMLVPPASKATLQPADRIVLAKLSGWGNDQRLINAGPLIMLTTQMITEIHPDLLAASSKWEAVRIDMPDAARRAALIERVLAKFAADDEAVILEEGVTIGKIANMTAGLSLVHVEDILLAAKSRGTLTLDLVSERKKSIMQSEFAGLLETVDNPPNFSQVGGHELIKNFLRKRVIRPLQDGDTRRAVKGALFTGAAGTGKSILAMGIAGEANVNFVQLRIGGNIASKWQGEGERNLEKALAAIVSLEPTICFIDEADQAMSRGNGGGNQQDNRIFQRMLEFMADPALRGKVVFIGATNRPDLMDAALKRPGRFDRSIPFLVPEPEDRTAIIKIMARKYMLVDDIKVTDEILALSDGWTGAELEAAVMKADELLYDEVVADNTQALCEAMRRLRPTTQMIEFMTKLAIQECNDIDLLPTKYRDMAANKDQLKKDIEQIAPVDRTSRRRALD